MRLSLILVLLAVIGIAQPAQACIGAKTTHEELVEDQRRFFLQADENIDAHLSYDEFLKGVSVPTLRDIYTKLSSYPYNEKVVVDSRHVFDQLDTNKSGDLDFEEFSNGFSSDTSMDRCAVVVQEGGVVLPDITSK